MSTESDYDKTYEVTKEVEAVDTMQLVDLNGSKINFQSDCLVATKDPSKNVMVAIVNQDELDNGEFKFEPTEEGKYARRVTFDENIKKNHFLCIKKHPSDPDETTSCNVIVRMKEIPPKKVVEKREMRKVPEKIQERDQERDMRQRLESLAKDKHYQLLRQKEEEKKALEKEREREREREDVRKSQIEKMERKSPRQRKKNEDEDNDDEDDETYIKRRGRMLVKQEGNPYYKIAIFCLVMFCLIMVVKVMKRG